MGLIVEKTDFVGDYKVASTAYENINLCIDKYEELYLIQLLGVELFDLFKASVTNHVPAAGIYKTIFDPIRLDDDNCIKISEGIKTMLLGFIYFEYIRNQKYYNTPQGTLVGQAEIGRETSFDETIIYENYNHSVRSYRTIQWYINEHETDYPKYNGQHKQLANYI